MSDYVEFVQSKKVGSKSFGFDVESVNQQLFDYQQFIVKWAIAKGRAAIFADTGLGKTAMQVEWAKLVCEQTNGNVLILAPLCVAQQTVEEAEKFGIKINFCRKQENIVTGINITNYEQMHNFDFTTFSGVVLDESSILKSYTGKTKQALIEQCSSIPYRLACTATPSPNDYLELGNHAEFLGIMPSNEMIMRFFINDTMSAGDYRLKGHSIAPFWDWVASWAMCISSPADIGFDGSNHVLPSLNQEFCIIDVSDLPTNEGELFRSVEMSATNIHKEGRLTASHRAKRIAELVNGNDEQWLIWVNTNYEADEITALVKDAVEVRGADTENKKINALMGFTHGTVRVLITKPSIAGFGMNWQHCNNMAFMGLSYSYEDYYQAIRRCWRFGQKKEVNVFVLAAESETAIMETVKRKEESHNKMKGEMVAAISGIYKSATDNVDGYFGSTNGENFELHHGDCVHVAKMLDDESIGFSVYSPPFSNLYIYSDSVFDMGNCVNDSEFFEHYRFLARELLRITKSGRLTAIHCKDLPMYKGRDGAAGLKDFPGEIIRMYESEGWQYHSRVTIWKDPVIEMQRTKNHGLLYKQLCKDSAASRQGMADYIIVMRKWGDETKWDSVTTGGERFCDYVGMTQCAPTAKDLSMARTEIEKKRLYSISVWQRYASPVWFDINQTNVLNYKLAREDSDERHICPLQLDVISRCIDLWSNPNDVVLSPFNGIGSEGVVALQMGRKYIGIELKEAYYNIAKQNLREAENIKQGDLFA